MRKSETMKGYMDFLCCLDLEELLFIFRESNVWEVREMCLERIQHSGGDLIREYRSTIRELIRELDEVEVEGRFSLELLRILISNSLVGDGTVDEILTFALEISRKGRVISGDAVKIFVNKKILEFDRTGFFDDGARVSIFVKIGWLADYIQEVLDCFLSTKRMFFSELKWKVVGGALDIIGKFANPYNPEYKVFIPRVESIRSSLEREILYPDFGDRTFSVGGCLNVVREVEKVVKSARR